MAKKGQNMTVDYQLIPGILWVLANIRNYQNNESCYMNTTVINGFDETSTCDCCGGLKIRFEDDTKPYSAPFYIINNNPADLGITEESRFPCYLNIDWEADVSPGCSTPHIYITRFSKIN
jgi:hypothetical protein